MDQKPNEVWAQRVEQWRASGLTASEFSVAAGIKPQTLMNWAWRLNAEAKRAKQRALPAGFIEVLTKPQKHSPASSVMVPGADAGTLEVVLKNGRILRVPMQFDESAVLRMVTLLEAR